MSGEEFFMTLICKLVNITLSILYKYIYLFVEPSNMLVPMTRCSGEKLWITFAVVIE